MRHFIFCRERVNRPWNVNSFLIITVTYFSFEFVLMHTLQLELGFFFVVCQWHHDQQIFFKIFFQVSVDLFSVENLWEFKRISLEKIFVSLGSHFLFLFEFFNCIQFWQTQRLFLFCKMFLSIRIKHWLNHFEKSDWDRLCGLW